VSALADPDEAVQTTAAEAVRSSARQPRAVPALEKLISSKQEFVRDTAKRADRGPHTLGRRGTGLEQGEPKVRSRALFMLGLMGPAARDALPALKAVAAAEADASLRAAAAEAIRRIETK
jgi:HEAT repeat protein